MTLAHSYMLDILPAAFGAKPPRLCSKATIDFMELVRPDSYWPQPYSLEQAFQLYRWLIRTGKPYSLYGQYGVYDLLIGRGVMGSTDLYYEPIISLPMLREVFHRAILGRPNCRASVTWREKERIAVGQRRILHFPHYAPFVGTPLLGRILSEAQIRALLKAYFAIQGNLIVQLNPCHKEAVEIDRLVITVDTYDFRFVFKLGYGYDGSVWWHELAEGEQFINTLGVALTEFERVSGQSLLASI
jgi:hypothetical protein